MPIGTAVPIGHGFIAYCNFRTRQEVRLCHWRGAATRARTNGCTPVATEWKLSGNCRQSGSGTLQPPDAATAWGLGRPFGRGSQVWPPWGRHSSDIADRAKVGSMGVRFCRGRSDV